MTSGRVTNILMDVDTGVDDAMALAMAVASPELNLLGVTTVAGNVSLDRATCNTLRVLDYLGACSVPVYRGMSRPLVRDHFDAAHFHGQDGIGGTQLPDSSRGTELATAPEIIIQTARQFHGDVTFVFVGPLTNLAIALALEPELPRLVDRTIVMGGAFSVPGNASSDAEFNIAVDPEAAQIVADSTLDVSWIGLDVTRQSNLLRRDWDAIDPQRKSGAEIVRKVCRQSFEDRGLDAVHLHDPLAVGVALHPDLVQCVDADVMVDTSVRATAGKTRMSRDTSDGTNHIARSVDSERFRKAFGATLGIPIEGS